MEKKTKVVGVTSKDLQAWSFYFRQLFVLKYLVFVSSHHHPHIGHIFREDKIHHIDRSHTDIYFL